MYLMNEKKTPTLEMRRGVVVVHLSPASLIIVVIAALVAVITTALVLVIAGHCCHIGPIGDVALS
jgi:hypothetical protein